MEKLTLDEVNRLEKFKKDMPEEIMKQWIYWKGFYDINFFSDFFLLHWKQGKRGYIKSPYYAKQIWDYLTADNNMNVIIARGHGKTTNILMWIIWALVYKRKKNILYIASSGLGEEGIGKIREELSANEKLRYFFGSLTPDDISSKKEKQGKKWRQRELELLNGTRLQTLSKGQSVRGKRPDKIILDDPQENKDVKNKRIVDDFHTWFFTSLYNTLLPGGSICVLGTIIGNLCLVKYLRDEKKWHTIEYKAIMDGKPLWSDMWSLDSLTDRKKQVGTAYFNQEFMNIPLSKEDNLIKDEWIRYYVPPLEFDYIILAVDPATKTKEQNDFTGICAMGIKDNKKYVIFSKGVKLAPRQLEQYIVNLNDALEPDIIIKEDNVEVKLTDDLKSRGLPIQSIWSSKDKYTRLLAVVGMIEVGDVYFLNKKQEELIDQLTNYPDVGHDDEMDAFVFALQRSQEWLEKEKGDGGVILI